MDDDFREYVATRGAALLRSAVLLTGDRGHAEDLVQTALIKVYARWGRIRSPEAVDAYVRRALLTTYLNWWRRRWRGEVPTDRLPEHAEAGGFDRVEATLVRDLGFLRGPGRLTIGGWSGRPTWTEQIVLRRPVDPRASGNWKLLTYAQAQFVVSDQVGDVPLPPPHRRYDSTRVIASCLGLGRMELLISPVGTVPLTCDGQPHELYAGSLDTGTDKIFGVGRNDLAARRTSLALTVLVVRAFIYR